MNIHGCHLKFLLLVLKVLVCHFSKNDNKINNFVLYFINNTLFIFNNSFIVNILIFIIIGVFM